MKKYIIISIAFLIAITRVNAASIASTIRPYSALTTVSNIKLDDTSSKLFNDIEYLLILFKRVIKNINHSSIRLYIDNLLTIVHRAIENGEVFDDDVIKIESLFDAINDQVFATKIFYGKYSIPQLQEAITQVKKTFKCSDKTPYANFQRVFFKFELFSHILSDKIEDLVSSKS